MVNSYRVLWETLLKTINKKITGFVSENPLKKRKWNGAWNREKHLMRGSGAHLFLFMPPMKVISDDMVSNSILFTIGCLRRYYFSLSFLYMYIYFIYWCTGWFRKLPRHTYTRLYFIFKNFQKTSRGAVIFKYWSFGTVENELNLRGKRNFLPIFVFC